MKRGVELIGVCRVGIGEGAVLRYVVGLCYGQWTCEGGCGRVNRHVAGLSQEAWMRQACGRDM